MADDQEAKVFAVKDYAVMLFRSLLVPGLEGCRATILCRGADAAKEKFTLRFHDPAKEPPENETSFVDGSATGTCYLPMQDYVACLDLLRNESPVYVILSRISPLQNRLLSDREKVGAGDDDAVD